MNMEVTEPCAFETTPLYQAIHKYVEAYMSRYDLSHDFAHIQRVLALAKHILATQHPASDNDIVKPDPDELLNPEYRVVVLCALLHDVGDKKYLQPGQDAAQMVAGVLHKCLCPTDLAVKVCTIIPCISYSHEVANPELVQQTLRTHPELAIVQDADRLDAIGAVGIARVFAFGGAKMPGRGLEGCVAHFGEKLERLEGMMKTAEGKRLARERTERLRVFKGWWEEENGGKV